MNRNTHPVVVVLAVIGGIAMVAVIGMVLMMGSMSGEMRMLGC